MNIKTTDLEGAALDYAVAAATGAHDDGEHAVMEIGLGRYSPSTDWSQGGPLIAKFVTCVVDDESRCYADTWAKARCYGKPLEEFGGSGTTVLIAAMRAIVASELGTTVDVPEELVK